MYATNKTGQVPYIASIIYYKYHILQVPYIAQR